MITSPMSFPSTPARTTASRMTTAPRSAADQILEHAAERPDGRPARAQNDRIAHDSSSSQVNLQLGPVPELIERVRIRERFPVVDAAAVHHVAHGELYDLAALRPRDLADLHDALRHVARGGVGPHAVPDPLLERGVQRLPLAQPHEENDPFVPLPLLSNDQALDDFIELLDLAVDLRGADPDAAGVQHRVGAAVDDDPAVRRQLHVVAMAPHARVALEVGCAVLAAVRIVPEPDGHRGKRLRADQLPLLAYDRRAGFVEDLDLHPECAHLDFAAPDWARRVAADETADDVGAAGNRRQVDIRLDVFVHEVEALRRKRRPCRRHGPETAETVCRPRADRRLADRVDELRGGAEERHAGFVGKVEQHGAVRVQGRTVEEQQGGFGCQRRDEPVPHHPSARREVEDAVVVLDVAVELVLFQMLDERAAGAVHDALGSTPVVPDEYMM